MSKIDMEAFKETCRKLVRSSAVLNEASDTFTKQVVVVEDAIKALNLGLRASVPYGNSGASLSYTKGKSGWGLYIITSKDSRFGQGEWKFIDAPRVLRIAAVDAIPELMNALGNDANQLAIEMEAAALRAREMLKDIK